MNTSQAIREQIAAIVPGTPFTPAYFAGIGSRASIDQTLMRLAQEQRIERISRGIYTVPKASRFGLKQMPSPESVAQTVAAAEGATIDVHGAEAARRFGFSTQVPAQPVFYTTGRSHRLQMGKMEIRLQHVAPRKMILAGRPAGQALSALWYLGREHVTPASFAQIASKLRPSEFEALCGAKTSMPAWMVEALRGYEKERKSTHHLKSTEARE